MGAFHHEPFALSRIPTTDVFRVAKRMHHVPVLLEVDVTVAREALSRRRKGAEGEASFTAWAVRCIAQAIAEHKRVQARRSGRRRLVVFHDVDVALVAYRRVVGDESRDRVPMPFVVRRAAEKTFEAIASEIRTAQGLSLREGQQVLAEDAEAIPSPALMRMFLGLPYLLRRWLVWDRLTKNPFRAKKAMGTVMVTSAALATGTSGWGIPASMHTLAVVLGSVARKPGLVEGRVEPREFLSLTVLFDHDVVDGMPVALFLKRLVELLGTGAYL